MSRIKKNKSLNASQHIVNKIPYESVYEEEGMIETMQGTFSKTYFIEDVDANNIKLYNADLIANAFGQLLNGLPDCMAMQFTIHNKLVQQEVFLKKVLQMPDKEEQVNNWIDEYNKTVTENSTIGHNNVKKNKYFTISTVADNAEDAVAKFRAVDQKIRMLFSNICDISVGGLSITSRLKVLYSMYNPKSNDFGKKADLRGDGVFKLENMKKLKLTTKDCIAPNSFDTSNKDYIIINGDTYVRVFFITSLPVSISQNLFSDITNISSNMIFSATYEPIDSTYGFNAVKNRVAENTVIRQTSKRDTIADRRNKTMLKNEVMINENEQAYFDKEALKVMQSAVAVQEKTMMCSFIIALYADDLETLDRDTKMLHLSTSKFACQVKSLDLQQLEGFQSVLPFCNPKVDVRRIFNISKLSTVSPLNIHEVLQKDGLFCGLNSINDNLILLNRKNNPNLAGLIAGTEHSGKTFQCKREIFNALISTNDIINVISVSDDYDNFVCELGGTIIEGPFATNPFAMMGHYGLNKPDLYSKSIMLEAYLESLTRVTEKYINLSQNIYQDDVEEHVDEIGDEIQRLCDSGVDFNKADEVLSYISHHVKEFPLFISKFEDVKDRFTKMQINTNGARLVLYKVSSLTEMILVMDYLWNKQIDWKMNNKSSWIFIDSVDDMFSSEQASAYISDYVYKTNAMQNVLTLVIQSSVKLFTDPVTSYRTEEFISVLGYHKLLNQGAIERQKYIEVLNIPNMLSNYITATELGKGIILTPSSNIAFDDSFYESDLDDLKSKSNFYSLFKI